MSAIIYSTIQWCKLTPEEITGVIEKIKNGNIYKGEDFYNEVKAVDGWVGNTYENNSVLIWNSDDAGPITIDEKEIGLFVHYNENEQMFDWACTYEIDS